MSKQPQHMILAIEKDIKTSAAKVISECSAVFNKSERFIETSKRYTPLNDADNDRPDEEFSPMVTTVDAKLTYVRPYVEKVVDVLLQKEATNQIAKANVILENGEIIAKDIPVSALLQYESIFADFRNQVLNTIPTNDPKINWTESTETGERIYVADTVETKRTIKVQEFITLDVGEKFPKAIEKVSKDQVVGTWYKGQKSGMLSPYAKSQLLKRCDEVIEAIKKARAYANSTEVVNVKCAANIFDFIFGK